MSTPLSETEKPKRPAFRLTTRGIVLVLLLSVVALLVPLPIAGRISRAVGDLLHAPCFAVLSGLVYVGVSHRLGRGDWRLAIGCWMFLATFGFLTEYLQDFFGRDTSYRDAASNLSGVTVGVMWSASRQIRQQLARSGLGLVAITILVLTLVHPALVLLDVAQAWRQFPQLSSVENRLEMMRWHARAGELTRDQQGATDGRWSLRVDMQRGRIPGAILTTPHLDWSIYQEFVLDLELLPSDAAGGKEATSGGASSRDELEVTIKVQDDWHNYQPNDRFERRVTLQPGRPRQVRIPIAEIAEAPAGRQMHMRHIQRIEVISEGLRGPSSLLLDNIRLE